MSSRQTQRNAVAMDWWLIRGEEIKEGSAGIFRAECGGNWGPREYYRNLSLCQMTELGQQNKTGEICFCFFIWETRGQTTTCVYTPVCCVDVMTMWERVHAGSTGRCQLCCPRGDQKVSSLLDSVREQQGSCTRSSPGLCGRSTEVRRDE